MKSHLVLLALVGFAYASTSPAWKVNTDYVYLVNGRTFTSLHGLSDQYSGIFLRAKLHIIALSDGKLQATIPVAEYAQIHSELSEGWNTHVPESQLTYKPLDLSNKPFEIVLKDGLIKSLIVEKHMTNWQANIIKSIVSQFQLDVKGKNVISSPMNTFPREDRFDGVFKTMEETVTGETETSYEIHRLPEYLIQSEPWLVPQPDLKGNGQIIEIIKNKNYTNSDEMPSYYYGFGELTEGHPTNNKMGKFFTRVSESRVVVTGKLSGFTVQSTNTFNKIIVNPTLNAKEQGSVVSIVNLTLHEVKTQSGQPQKLVNPIKIGNLVYTYESPFALSNEVKEKQEGSNYLKSSSEQTGYENVLQRLRRGIITKLQRDDSSSSSSSSEETIQYQSTPLMDQPPAFPLLPYYMAYEGRSIKTNPKFDLKQNIKRITKEVSEEVQEPEKILNHSTLSKYAMLCSLMRLLNEEEIRYIAEELYPQSKQVHERLAWVVFRDAVADTGTSPAFLTIERWIQSGKIEKEEATEVIAAMANSARVPTKEYMERFFELVKKLEVSKHEYLNETALLVFTNLVRQVNVDSNKSYNQYPVHTFNSFYTKEGKEFVKDKVIPYLTQKLHNAVSQGDSHKIHLYIRALGNVADRKILMAFEPYLEGEKQMSQFQRMLIVLSLDKLAESNPEVASSVLYKIYQNVAEVPEVRVVAVHQLIRTNPSVEMIQRMAENTNIDSQEQVNAAVKYVIESASQLKSVEYQKLRKAAESAKPLLTRKQYGLQYSLNFLQEFVIENMGIEYHHNLLQVGSTDSNLPKGFNYGVRGNFNGIGGDLFNVQAMLSSIRELMNVLNEQTQNMNSPTSYVTPKESLWTSPKIAELLNLQTNEREQLEGFFYAQIEHIHQLFSFDNKTIAQLPQVIRAQEEILKNGKELSYTKLRQLKELVLSFPTEMGLPFLYTYDQPIFVQFQGRIMAAAQPEISRNNKLFVPQTITAKVNGFVTVSSKHQSQLKIVTPFDHHMYIAGNDKNFQVHLPIKTSVDIDVVKHKAKIQFNVEETHKDARVIHYSSWPYTSRNDIMNLSPVALSPTTYLIKPQGNSHRYFDFEIGQKETGISFRVWGHHPQQSKNLLDLVRILQTADISTMWQQVWDEASLHQTEANIALIPGKTTTSQVILRLGYQEKYNKQPEIEYEEYCSMERLSSRLEQQLEQRQRDMLKCVGARIQSAKLKSFDGSVEFVGQQTYKHVFTLAYAKSNVDPLSRLIALYKINSGRPSEYGVQIEASIPNNNELDLIHSLKNKPKNTYDVHFHQKQWEEISKLRALVTMSRSEKRRAFIERQPMYEVCKKQMEQGNRHLSACQNQTIESGYLDNIRIQLEYEDMKTEWFSYIERIFKGVRFLYYPMTEITPVQLEENNKIIVDVQIQPEHLGLLNVTVNTKEEQTKFFNLSISEMTKTVLVQNPMYNLKTRVLGKLMAQDNFRPTCVIDKRAAQTLSNLTYSLSLSPEWRVMTQYIPQQARPMGQSRQHPTEQLRNQQQNVVVLVREKLAGYKEVKIIFSLPMAQSRIVEITLKLKEQGSSHLVSVLVDGKEVQYNNKQATELYNGLVEIYALPSGEVKVELQNWFYLVFNGDIVKLTATSDNLRDSVVGLCGRFSDDKYEDFWTPSNCIVRSAEKFAKSFILEARQQQPPQKYEHCIPKVLPLYANVISDLDVKRTGTESDQPSSTGITLRSRYVEEDGNVCFTLHPVPVCNGPVRDAIFKDVPVHCITNTKTAYYLRNQIDQGGNPDFSHKVATKSIQMEIPKQCY